MSTSSGAKSGRSHPGCRLIGLPRQPVYRIPGMASPSRRCADGSEKLNRLTELRNSAGLRRARLQPVATIGRGRWEMIMSRYLVVLTLTGSIFGSLAAGAVAHAGAADSYLPSKKVH